MNIVRMNPMLEIHCNIFETNMDMTKAQTNIMKYAAKKEFKFRTYSDVSQQLFKNIDDKYLPAKQNSWWEIKNHEFELYLDIDGVKYFSKVDFFFDGKIIEFNGDIWHANPQKFKANDKLSFKNDFMKTAQDAWDYDARRIAALEKLGYKVKVVWELDYKLDSSKVVDECIQFLKSDECIQFLKS